MVKLSQPAFRATDGWKLTKLVQRIPFSPQSLCTHHNMHAQHHHVHDDEIDHHLAEGAQGPSVPSASEPLSQNVTRTCSS